MNFIASVGLFWFFPPYRDLQNFTYAAPISPQQRVLYTKNFSVIGSTASLFVAS